MAAATVGPRPAPSPGGRRAAISSAISWPGGGAAGATVVAGAMVLVKDAAVGVEVEVGGDEVTVGRSVVVAGLIVAGRTVVVVVVGSGPSVTVNVVWKVPY
jgi:hypothetical protein